MKIRPQRNKVGLTVSLSKKFYQRSTFQTQQQIQKIQSENDVKKQMIRRMNVQLHNLQQFLNQTCLSRQAQKKNDSQPNNNHKSSMSTIKTQKSHRSPNKNAKSNNSINIKLNSISKSPQGQVSSPKGKLSSPQGQVSSQKGKLSSQKGKLSSPKGKLSSPKGFTRSKSSCKHSSKRNSNRSSFASVKRNSKFVEQQQTLTTKQQIGAKSYQQLKSHKRLSSIKVKKDENYVKYLECRLRQLAKEVKMHNEAQLKIQKRQMGHSRRV